MTKIKNKFKVAVLLGNDETDGVSTSGIPCSSGYLKKDVTAGKMQAKSTKMIRGVEFLSRRRGDSRFPLPSPPRSPSLTCCRRLVLRGFLRRLRLRRGRREVPGGGVASAVGPELQRLRHPRLPVQAAQLLGGCCGSPCLAWPPPSPPLFSPPLSCHIGSLPSACAGAAARREASAPSCQIMSRSKHATPPSSVLRRAGALSPLNCDRRAASRARSPPSYPDTGSPALRWLWRGSCRGGRRSRRWAYAGGVPVGGGPLAPQNPRGFVKIGMKKQQ
ncbi:uncharacterized protein PHA67_017533 [Liasis olivaceus]